MILQLLKFIVELFGAMDRMPPFLMKDAKIFLMKDAKKFLCA